MLRTIKAVTLDPIKIKLIGMNHDQIRMRTSETTVEIAIETEKIGIITITEIDAKIAIDETATTTEIVEITEVESETIEMIIENEVTEIIGTILEMITVRIVRIGMIEMTIAIEMIIAIIAKIEAIAETIIET